CSSASLYHGDVMQQDAAPAFVAERTLCPSMVPDPRPGAPAPQRAGTALAAGNPLENGPRRAFTSGSIAREG
ncbi:hypothetical protein RZS08_34790, partial [Arthrospira platensis SPKY1]|nr:hypothetical protein [Arthrospira platensis SPKY1]